MADIFGLELNEPPEGWACLDALVLGKALDTDGRIAMFIRNTRGLSNIDSLGLLAAAIRTIGDDVAECFVDEEPDGEDDDTDA